MRLYAVLWVGERLLVNRDEKWVLCLGTREERGGLRTSE